MPLVGMRRSTRVFVPKSVVKDAEGARVLRSGKRFSLDCDEGKLARGNGDEWFRIIENSDDVADVPCYKSVGWYDVVSERDVDFTHFNVKLALQESAKNKCTADENVDKMFGIVYGRKRRRLPRDIFVSSSQWEDMNLEDRMYGISFFRKQRRKRAAGHSLKEFPSREGISELAKDCHELAGNSASEACALGHETISIVHGAILDIVVESSCNSARWFTCLLVSILNLMRSSRIRLSELAAFMFSGPLVRVFSHHGVHFVPNLSRRISWKNNFISPGICQIFGVRQFIPLFSLNFCASPFTFMGLHFDIALRSFFLSDVLVRFQLGLTEKVHGFTDNKKCLSCVPTERVFSGSNNVASGSASVKKRKVDYVVRPTDLVRRSVSTRYGANSRNVQRKRTSMRSTRARHPSSMGLHSAILHSNANGFIKTNHAGHKIHGSIGSDLFRAGYGRSSLSTPGSNQKKRKIVHKNPCNNVKEMKSTLVALRENMDSVCCSANILVIESDRCFREEGAKVMLECLASKDWYLVAKTQGFSRYMHKAQTAMRPSTSNRFTHAMLWTGGNGWKLEFSNKQDWLIFKELHKECIDRNLQVASGRTIPVPGVYEVACYGDSNCVPFGRPIAYITMHDDEVSRALARKTANYDLDSDDEEWLEKLNNGLFGGNDGVPNYVSADKFEEMIDSFEKAAYHTPDDVSDENRAASFCLALGNSDIVAAVYQYWLKKREQKHVALLRVFQCPPPRRSQLMQNPVFRKKRSFKRQMSQSGRSKQQSFFQALAAEREQQAMNRVQKAKRSADSSMESVLLKRRRAQILMDNADLATYKAAMAVKIAEVAQLALSPDAIDSLILD